MAKAFHLQGRRKIQRQERGQECGEAVSRMGRLSKVFLAAGALTFENGNLDSRVDLLVVVWTWVGRSCAFIKEKNDE
jgi:hypothetical protein